MSERRFFMPYKDPQKAREAKQRWERKNRAAGTRHRVWMFVFYEDSADEGWRDTADELGLPFLVSPLHDKDAWTSADERKNPDHKAGEVKRPHFHGLVEYPQPVAYDQVKEDFAFLGTHSIKYAKSKASMALYLCHIKSHDKAPYDPADVLEYGGANWHDWCSELEDVHALMREMREFIRENNITEFDVFQDWCDENCDTWSRALDLKCAWAIGHYIERRRGRLQQQARIARAAVSRQQDEAEREDVAEVAWGGLSATPPQGGAEPRTPNPADNPRSEACDFSGFPNPNPEPEPEPEPEPVYQQTQMEVVTHGHDEAEDEKRECEADARGVGGTRLHGGEARQDAQRRDTLASRPAR